MLRLGSKKYEGVEDSTAGVGYVFALLDDFFKQTKLPEVLQLYIQYYSLSQVHQ